MYMRNRYYDLPTGQFTQTDPIGLAGGLNSYGFAAGDPVSYSDPYGLKACPESAGGDGKTDSYADCPEGSSGYYAYRAAQGEGGAMNTVRGVVAACREDTACKVGGICGTGQAVAGVAGQPGFRERVNFGQVIGQLVDQASGAAVNTTNGMIHYSARGAHIVPSAP
jgi:uncharacterized protein RhaS with RHS repeats